MFALIDGNNFYVACERAFNPRLQARAVVVLSNNDGCVIARSEEAKRAGVAMGQPFYQLQAMVQTQQLTALSANFALYGDMSARMMRLAAALGPEQEIYSIDESFIGGLQGVPQLTLRARTIRARVLRCLGIPCCIGLGPTKTLAKLCNHVAKAAERGQGGYAPALAQVCNWRELSAPQQQQLLEQTPVAAVWGVGTRLGQRLAALRCHSAADLARLPSTLARKAGGVVLERTARELQGIRCMDIHARPSPQHQIACTRSFGHPVQTLQPLLEAVSEFTSRAAAKARHAGLLARQVHVFAYTSPFRPHEAPWHGALTLPLSLPSHDTRVLVAAATTAAKQLFRSGHRLSKAGVLLLDLQPQSHSQTPDLFAPDTPSPHSPALMQTLDSLNQRYGPGTIHLASCGQPSHDPTGWRMKQALRSPLYTQRYADLPIAHA